MLETFKEHLQKHVSLTDTQFEELSKHLKLKKVPKHTVLLSPGEVCEHSFFVVKGLLRSYTIDASGKEHIIQFASETWFMSDRSSIYFNEPSDFFIDVIEESSVIFFDKDFIECASEIIKDFRAYNDRMLHKHILHMQKRIKLITWFCGRQALHGFY